MRIIEFFRSNSIRRWVSLQRPLAIGTIVLLLLTSALPAAGQGRNTSPKFAGASRAGRKAARKTPTRKKSVTQKDTRGDASITAQKIISSAPIEKLNADIMIDQAARGEYKTTRELLWEKGLLREEREEGPDREELPDGPGARPASQYPYPNKAGRLAVPSAPEVAPQTLGTTFDGATGPTETGAFPPDTMGAVGPTQFVVFLNGRLRTFNKTTGVADGVLNVDSDVFFASLVSTPGAGEAAFTSDPNVRFDRLSNRWFLHIVDVVINTTTGQTTRANRLLFAVSDAASNGTISGSTVWTLYQFQGDATLFTDYTSLGIDANALYIGGDMFAVAGGFQSTKGFVIPKAPFLTASPLTVWAFSGLVASAAGAGPFAPRGVDNPDPTNTGVTATGYFIGPDNATFNTLMLRRVTNPGSLGPAPTISANISVATPLTTRFPVLVPHLGNTGGNNGRLASLDDRLYAAVIRNGRLWTAHNIGVNNTGVAGATNNRNAARWYELQSLGTTPTVRQSGTLYDNNATNDANQRNYWIPSIAVSGQGHSVLACSIAGTSERANAFYTGRLSGDTLGTMRDGPGGTALPGYTATASAYNPPSDPGGSTGRRWGDYSFTSLDPKDDMTMWTVQMYTNGTNTYGVRVAKLVAPPPASIANGPGPGGVYQVLSGQSSINVPITGSAPAGQGFYDPGPDPAAPHTPFTHISATVTGPTVTVNSVTYNSPTSITLNLNTVGAATGLRTLTITNPDGQQVTRSSIINILPPTAAPASLGGRITDNAGRGLSRVTVTLTNQEGTNTRYAVTNAFGYYQFDSVPTGENYVLTPTSKRYEFAPANLLYSHQGQIANLDFVGSGEFNRNVKPSRHH